MSEKGSEGIRGGILLTVGSLFSGAGLCDLGLHWAGLKHQWFCEVDPFCRAILARHWPGIPIHEDVRKLKGQDLAPVDVLCGGFPCQDVSSANCRRAGIKPGTRSGLWHEYARLIKEIRPKYAIVENVLGLLSKGFEIVLKDLAAIGYDAEWEVLSAAALGVPHHRERLFIVAYPMHGPASRRLHGLYPQDGNMGDDQQSWKFFDWLGVRFDRARKAAALEACGGAVLCRMDDGSASGLDGYIRPAPGREHKLISIDRATARQWRPRLKALGNGITPQQAYAIAASILEAEGFSPLAMPLAQESF